MTTTPTTPTTGTATETRALAAAMSAPTPFTGRAAQAALHASDRHVDRWAPERDATRRSRSLGSVAFADRILGPWLAAAEAAPMSRAGATTDRSTPQVSWLFPRPWYQDELDWAAAAREAEAQAQRGPLTTRGTYLRPGAAGPAPVRADQAVVVVAPSSFGAALVSSRAAAAPTLDELSYVAPSMTLASSGPGAMSGGTAESAPRRATSFALPAALAPAGIAAPAAPSPVARTLRAWTPQVSFAAAQAAELVAGASAMVEESGMSAAVRSPVLEGLAYVAPSDVASERTVEGVPAPAASATSADAVRLARVAAQLAVAQQARTATVEATSASVAQVPAPARPATAAQAPAQQAASASIVDAYRAEQARAVEQLRAAEVARAHQAEAPRADASADAVGSAAATPRAEDAAALAAFVELARAASLSPAAAASLRTAELVTRAALGGGAAPVSGPRVALPAGLGGAVVGQHAAQVVHGPAALAPRPMFSPSFLPAGAPAFTPGGDASPAPRDEAGGARGAQVRPFAPVWAATAHATPSIAAASEARPAAIGHLGWADRWLARFAGASPASLAAFDAGQERIPAMPRALAGGAPEIVFVVPLAEAEQRHAEALGAAPARRAAPAIGAAPRAVATSPTLGASAPTPSPAALRFDDADATPDEVLHAIARAARPGLPAPRGAAAAPAAPVAASVEASPASMPSLPTVADRVARAVPAAPSAGLHAQLASSPLAPALTASLGLPSAPVFDPRALYPAGALAAYLAGASTSVSERAAQFLAGPRSLGLDAPSGDTVEGSGLSLRAPAQTFVAPFTPGALATGDMAGPSAPAAARPAAPDAWRVHAPLLASPVAWSSSAAAPAPFDGSTATSVGAAPAVMSSLPFDAAGARASAEAGAAEAGAAETWSELAAPLVAPPAASWTARPGGTAERTQQMAIARERGAADLAYDFVSPELVLAARIYGFGPAEAAQASRLAVHGHGGLAAMASALDLTFLRQLQGAHEAREAEGAAPVARRAVAAPAQPVVTAYPVSAPAVNQAAGQPAAGQPVVAQASGAVTPGAAAPSSTVFGVERRLPRGAFLWPAGAVGAMDLHAQAPEGHDVLPVAALELLAANAVAAMAYVSPTALASAETDVPGAAGAPASPAALAAHRAAAARGVPLPAAGAPGDATLPSMATSAAADHEPPVAVVADAYNVAPAQRARFETVYLALSRAVEGASLSPSVRAARALAIAARPEHGHDASPTTARERAALAWSALPVVYAMPSVDAADREEPGAAAVARGGGGLAQAWAGAMPTVGSGGAAASAARSDREPVLPETRAGLVELASRVGEALGSFVQPTAAELGPTGAAVAAQARSAPATAPRATAAQERSLLPPSITELIRTGRPVSRAGGGEAEIPAWFESAARRMLDQSGAVDGISLAELTLIATAPVAQVAAASRGSSGPSAQAAPSGSGGQAEAQQGPKADIEKLAQQVYGEILKLLDIARERSGDPWH